MSETPTPAMLKLGAAAAGGYVLGRFKKGRAALGLGLWLAGSRTGLDPRRMVRQGLLALLNSPEGKEVLGQLRGPVFEAGRRAAAATLESQAGALAKALEDRTTALTSGKPGEDEAEDEDAGHDEDEYDEDEGAEDEGAEDEEDEQEEEEPEEAPRPRKATARQPRKAAEQPRKAAGRQPRKATGRQRGDEDGGSGDEPRGEEQPRKRARRSASESRSPRRPRKEGARS